MLGSLWVGIKHHTVKLLQKSPLLIAAPDVSGGACWVSEELRSCD